MQETQVQQETPCDSRQMHEETAKWQGLVVFYAIYQELVSGKGPERDFEGLACGLEEIQVQQETPWDSGLTQEETAEWQGLADTLSLTLDETNPLLLIFQFNYVVLLQSWKAKLQSLSRLVTLALKIRNN